MATKKVKIRVTSIYKNTVEAICEDGKIVKKKKGNKKIQVGDILSIKISKGKRGTNPTSHPLRVA